MPRSARPSPGVEGRHGQARPERLLRVPADAVLPLYANAAVDEIIAMLHERIRVGSLA